MRPRGGNVPRNCVQGLRRVGWPRLTCDQGWNKAASTQVKDKREDLTRVMSGVRCPQGRFPSVAQASPASFALL